MTRSTLGAGGGLRCRACGASLKAVEEVCGICGIGPQSGRRFWRILWGGMILSTVLILIVCVLVVIYAPRFAPHLFEPDSRNLIP